MAMMEDDGNATDLATKQLYNQINMKFADKTFRQINFVEHELPETHMDNYYTSGIYKINFDSQLSQIYNTLVPATTEHSFDPFMLNQIITAPDEDRPRRPTRLVNLGSSCYMNSVIQVLFNCSYIAKLIQSPQFQQHQSHNQVFHALSKTYQKYVSCPKGQSVTPQEFGNVLSVLKFSIHQQSDAGELFYKLIDQICDYEAQQTGFNVKPHPNKDTTAFDQLLQQVHVQQIVCNNCGCCKTQSIFARSCLIPMSKTLRRAFVQFQQPAEISGYRCDGCGIEVTISKKNKITKCGNLFVVQLQRWDDHGQKSQKSCRINLFLKLSNGLDIGQIIEESRTSLLSSQESVGATHELIGVINHVGVENYGHYYSYVKTCGQWYMCNDEIVQHVDQSEVASGKGWILAIYQRIIVQQRVKRIVENAPQDVVIGPHNDQQTAKESRAAQDGGLRKSDQRIFEQEKIDVPDNLDEGLQKELQPGGILSRYSDILHTGQQGDVPRRRKTQEMRDSNRRERMKLVRERRQRKTALWREEQQRRKREKFAKK